MYIENKQKTFNQLKKENWNKIAKNMLLLFIPLYTIILLLSFSLFLSTKKSEIKVLKNIEEQNCQSLKKHLISDIKSVLDDLIFLSQQHDIRAFFNLENKIHPGNKKDLGNDFLAISKISGLYDQIRLLDINGMEILRVNYNSGDPSIIEAKNLQNKKHRYYFTESVILGKGEIFMSPLDLNIENKKIEIPLKPMIRFATPVYDVLGEKKGIVILNYFSKRIFENFKNIKSKFHTQYMMLNSDGYWLRGRNSKEEFGFMYNKKNLKFENDFSEEWKIIKETDRGQFRTEYGIFTFCTVFPLHNNLYLKSIANVPIYAGLHWKIVSLMSNELINININIWFYNDLLLLIVIGIILAIILFVYAINKEKRIIVENSLIKKEKYLEVLRDNARILLSCHESIPFQKLVDKIGPVCGASRVYIFDSKEVNSEILVTQIAEWCAKGVPNQINNPDLINFPIQQAFPRWIKNFLEGKEICGVVSEFPESEQKILLPQDIKAILVFPLILKSNLYGFIGFDNCINEELWEATEKNFLQTAADDLSQILYRKTIEKALKQSKIEWELTFDSIPDLISIHDNDFRIIKVNKAMEKKLGMSSEELIGIKCYKLIHDLDEPPSFCPHTELMKDGQIHEKNIFEKKLNGEFNVTVSPLFSSKDRKKIIGSVHVAKDVTQIVQRERRIRKINEMKEKLLAPDCLEKKIKLITDKIVEIFNADFARIWLVKEADKCEERCFHFINKNKVHQCKNHDFCLHLISSSGRYTHIDGEIYSRVPLGIYKIGKIATGEETNFIIDDVMKDPLVHDKEWAEQIGIKTFAGYRILSDTGKPIGVCSLFSKYEITSDTSALLDDIANTISQVLKTSQVEEQLKLIAEEKSILLREVNHRVKNNLTAIISMLHKEKERVLNAGQKNNLSILHDFETRIRGLLTVHNMLSANEWKPVLFSEVCEKIIKAFSSSERYKNRIKATVSKSKIRISDDQVRNLAIIINELVTNSFKYALKDREHVKISIEIKEEGSYINFTFKDDGPGISENILEDDVHGSKTGFYLIKGIIRKGLRGSIEAINDNGALIRIKFLKILDIQEN